jgi:hypothetical protein
VNGACETKRLLIGSPGEVVAIAEDGERSGERLQDRPVRIFLALFPEELLSGIDFRSKPSR